MVRLVGCVAVFAIFQGFPSWKIVFAPVIVFFALLLFAGLGLTLAIFNLAYRDIGKLTPVILQYGLLLSSVLFPLTNISLIAKISLYNPFYIFIESLRSLIIFGTIPHLNSLLAFCGASVVIFVFGGRLFQVSEQRLKGFA
jgi:lipopolysaccharide transport system permease protein